jgi:ABC-type lipoprotein release transport system permease subunit
MHFKLMVRGLARHKKRGRRLFVLLGLCSAALVFLLTFQQEFGRQYRDLFVGMQTGHLQILPPDSPALATNPWASRSEDTPLLKVTDDLDAWVRSQPEVAEAAPVLARYAQAYNLDSEWESWVSLIAVPADRMARLFPLAKVLEGPGTLTWHPGDPEVPVLHARLQTEFGQVNDDPDHFRLAELYDPPAGLDPFKKVLQGDFPRVFGSPDLSGTGNNQRFLDLWNAGLKDPDLWKQIPPAKLAAYDWKVDDALTAARDNQNPVRTAFLNKRLFQALYSRWIVPLAEPIVPGKSVTLQVAKLHSEGALDMPVLVPARYAGMVDTIPLYTPNSFLDLGAFRHFLGAPEGAATAYVVRLKDPAATAAVKTRIEGWLKDHGSDARVVDAAFLGKLFMATATAFDAILGILVGIFLVILVIFIVNLVLMSLIQRRREIGTGLALGLTNADTILILLGEVGVIVTVSWAAGCVLGALLVGAAHLWGVPGMLFFPGQRIFLEFRPWTFLQAFALLLPAALLAALVPLTGLRNLLPVDLFREAR